MLADGGPKQVEWRCNVRQVCKFLPVISFTVGQMRYYYYTM